MQKKIYERKIVKKLIQEASSSKEIVNDFVLKEIKNYNYIGYKKEILYALNISSNLYEKVFLLNSIGKNYKVRAEKLKHFAIAAELLMVGALTGDDVIDNGYLRGRKPTLMSKFGFERAQLVSNIILGLFNSAILEGQKNSDPIKSLLASKYFFEAYNNLFIGQHNLIALQGEKVNSIKKMDDLALSRVGSLFAACTTCPIILAGKNKLLKPFFNYGQWLGMAIQHRDDILDYIGEAKVMGKPQFQDLLNAQPNLVTASLLSGLRQNTDEFAVFNNLWGAWRDKNKHPKVSTTMQDDIIYLIESTNALENAIKHLKKCCSKAVKSLAEINQFDKSDLVDFANLVSEIER